MKKSIDYMLSVSLLKQLILQNLITDEEFAEIDLLNKKSFKARKMGRNDLMMCRSNRNM
ncbi:hypothetical protein OB236_09725 [Paenibacillus sp. WQ 127069]|uniref:SHOCT-like domain-containing protein n=1 Tax=Paenibacillus baimaensis TaxID=2982185 RepID=A0ABT2UCP1_9BACL|nr:SHOCT domain-containing protein [Paenibacillus sp. WQ 127069]MCU6792407.1 hypothetical protein [Paenibacillus sp. WQ 127069]